MTQRKRWLILTACLVLGCVASAVAQTIFPGFVPRTQAILGPSTVGSDGHVLTSDGAGGSAFEQIIAASITDDSLDFAQFIDAMTVDATTTVDLWTGAADVDLRFYNTDAPDELLFLDGSTGRVGIGTTTPQSLLDVQAGAGEPGLLTLSTQELTVLDGDILGLIAFNAPLESDGTDAIVVGASIWAEADDTFAADNNSTELVFATADSGAVAEAMRIDHDGNVGIGNTAPAAMLDIQTSGVNAKGLIVTGTAGQAVDLVNVFDAPGSEVFTILESGYVGIGNTAPVGVLDVESNDVNVVPLIVVGETNQSADLVQVWDQNGGTQLVTVDDDGNVQLSGGNRTIANTGGSLTILNDSGATNTVIRGDGSLFFDADYDNNESASIYFRGNAGTTRMIVTDAGNVGIGTTTFDGTAVGVLAINNGTAPAAGTANQSYMYAKDVSASSEMHVMDEAGNETQISPHDEEGEWIFYSENKRTGKRVRIEMEKLMAFVAEQYAEENGVDISEVYELENPE